MARRRSLLQSARTAIARVLAPDMARGYDAASSRRFTPEARMGRTATETLAAAPHMRRRARYFAENDAHAAAGVEALVTYAWGAGPVPAHENTELVTAFTEEFWNQCDADGRTNFGGLGALALRAAIVDGDCLVILRQRPAGLFLQLMPAEQLDESLTRELGGGAYIESGIEFSAAGERVAYWIRPHLPTQQFETYAPPVRVDAADVLHLFKPKGIGQIRGVSWLAPILLKLADLGLLSDALLKGFQVSALNSVYLIDRDGAPGLPFEGDKQGDALDVSLEPGAARILRGNWEMKANTPQQAQQSTEFMTAMIEEVAAGLGVPAFMVSGNVSRANYSSLRAALITFKAHLESIQHNIIVPQLLTPIWRRFVLTQQLRAGQVGEIADAEWRFGAMPEADPLKQIQAVKVALDAKLMSRAEAIAARGESIERVDADIAADPHAQAETEESADSDDEEKEPDSND